MAKRIYRSRTDSHLGGVCGGIAEFLDVDSTIVRLIFVLATLLGFSGLLAYLIAWIIIPAAPGY
ncbi:PspC domain-containing protein [Corynebacterium lizhenjunii]|uniref:PspC domain-containing protein n=1 Tax=Corynebacterium lizhenjunii TaxID=2709394 RepID=A0A7T0KEG0_9CORY|nr:PspC domain-containing protein [Corynebacterium lizhenjunii]QPK78806.1 PspC domain-containing protein [Corynebacterium lizhenjunii]